MIAGLENIPDELVEQAASGSIEAYEDIYRISSGFVYNVALRIVKNQNDALDVTQEVFIKIHRSLSKFNYRSSLKTWIYRITVNESINRYKKYRKERYFENDNFNGPNSTENSFESNEIKHKVHEMLEILNPKQKACVVLRDMEGLSYDEIAKVLRININTVRSRLKRAREALLDEFNKEDK
ncbi:RNA polymerase sigma factor [Elusimicrobiota bacterium]